MNQGDLIARRGGRNPERDDATASRQPMPWTATDPSQRSLPESHNLIELEKEQGTTT